VCMYGAAVLCCLLAVYRSDWIDFQARGEKKRININS
jgi:hypothetical protein